MKKKLEVYKKLKSAITKDVIYTGIAHLTRILSGFVSVLLIPIFLTKEVQGYWYSFISIAALSILADLGFNIIIVQFAAHEFAHLNFDMNNLFLGDDNRINKISSLFKFIIKRGVFVVAISFPIIFTVGFFILNSKTNSDVIWIIPWLIFVFQSGIRFLLNMITSFFEGCSRINVVQKIRYQSNLSNLLFNAIFLFAGFELFAISLGAFISMLILLYLSWKNFYAPIKQMLEKEMDYNWGNDVYKLLGKYALSYLGGYMIFQIYTPIAFRMYGPVYAGRVGITLTLFSAMFSVSTVWIYVANPKLNMLVALKNWPDMDKIFNKNLLLSIGTFLLLSLPVVFSIYLLHNYHRISDRFLGIGDFIFLSVAWCLQLIINAVAIYSRAHKVEKFIMPSLTTGIYVLISTLLISNLFPQNYFMIGFYTSFIFSFPWFYSIFFNHRKVAHAYS